MFYCCWLAGLLACWLLLQIFLCQLMGNFCRARSVKFTLHNFTTSAAAAAAAATSAAATATAASASQSQARREKGRIYIYYGKISEKSNEIFLLLFGFLIFLARLLLFLLFFLWLACIQTVISTVLLCWKDIL